MSQWFEILLVTVALPCFVYLGTSRIRTWIGFLALQGFALGILPLAVEAHHLTLRVILLALATMILKGIVLPRMLDRAMVGADVPREVEPFVGFNLSLLAGLAFLGGSFWLAARLPLPGFAHASTAVAVAFFNILTGLFLIVTRRKALTQVLGYIVLENGIYVFGVSLALQTPLLVEIGILLDVFVAVFVMGIMIFHISRTFDHIDTDRLSALKE